MRIQKYRYNADNCDNYGYDDHDDDFKCSPPHKDRDDDHDHHLHHPPSRVSSTSEFSLMMMMTIMVGIGVIG